MTPPAAYPSGADGASRGLSTRLPRVRAIPTRLSGPVLFEPVVHGDERGFFLESYRQDLMTGAGVGDHWVQDNHSRSRRGIVRGMHFQPGMAKLVRCVRGAIFDVVVDVRVGSPTFGEWEGYDLSDSNLHEFYCPDGFAHGFCVLTELADVVYKTSAYWDPTTEGGFHHADPAVGIEWPPGLELAASVKDGEAMTLAEITDSLPFRYAE
jgi:dTDP-4-dehydrorhamnose 3,5-epimerase